ncbi:hypothetical protein DICPUDRAFT_156850 [Dictyostelium purpureum]|uniref:Uncharacterized protein n=1 Tax=Dictyostelium purpureum TaxID=5786 RepID=F0ZXL4_DICPU|nr:uncharacterized protein DICPUDRAFT_156850 [Dictyostelium purpureum]EGC31318.1 hypothetical protein DICPUDRAFT_156850 [Dictyostelium purpureum]|eukprot:XP_003292162.1 hypothetical protein DICPUDRAFT_156850 [Dictyostelium purpureum]
MDKINNNNPSNDKINIKSKDKVSPLTNNNQILSVDNYKLDQPITISPKKINQIRKRKANSQNISLDDLSPQIINNNLNNKKQSNPNKVKDFKNFIIKILLISLRYLNHMMP